MAPLLADGFEVIISLIVFAVGFIGWISQIVNANKQQPQPPARRPAGRPNAGGGKPGGGAGADPLRNEIEAFLREVQAKTGAEPPPRPQPAEVERDAVTAGGPIETRDERSRPSDRSGRGERETVEAREAERLADHHLETSLSERHLPEMRPKGRKKRQRSIEQEVDRRVAEQQEKLLAANRATERKLADAEAALSDLKRERRGSERATSIRAMLADPGSIKNAIVVAEILNRPKRGV